ncbi:MAG: M16 family metallopeptidase [Phycisphaerae bacterium]
MASIVHDSLPCGMEYSVIPLEDRHVVSFQIRVLAGACLEPQDKLGLARLVMETLDKGTQKRSGRELSDAFDAIGASHGTGAGRETSTLTCTVLPEHFERAVALHAEMIRTPTFPEDAVAVNVELARQELLALEDDAQSLIDKLIGPPAYGSPLGRHPLGEDETLETISRDDLEAYWREHFHTGRMLLALAGAVEPERASAAFEEHFSGFGAGRREGRDAFAAEFTEGNVHHAKDLEQEHIGICWPGVDAPHDDFPAQQVVLGALAGGMSARLFTEIREKQGLVYWVNAWHETPRGSGRIFLGASTTPDRCEQTFATLLREVDRLADDVEPQEVERAVTGIVAHKETRGDTTGARCAELASDLFFFGRPVPPEEKIAKVQSVSVDGIRRYLSTYPRDRLCVMTLGTKALADPRGGRLDGATAT